ncbi:MAG: cytochrome c [Acidobacteriota bacterium]
MTRRISLFWSVVLTVVGLYLLLALAVPYLSMFITGRDEPLPVPSALMAIYLMLILIGVVVYLAADDARLREFWAPVQSFLRGPEGIETRGDRVLNIARWVVLAALPLLAFGVVYQNSVPSTKAPATLRIAHPTIPFEFQDLVNPYRNPDGTIDAAVYDEGQLLFQTNCRPCHGTPANGEGPMAYGFRLRPANFRSEDTIATVIEAYAFWRIREGGIGLPNAGSPWDSAMPAWKDELSDDQIWRIIAAEYQTAGVEPRRPERAPGE